MDNIPDGQLQYEKQVLFHLLIFRKAMDQYRLWGEESLDSPLLWNYPQYQDGMKQLIQVIKTCGKRFQEIPKPPEGIFEADRLLRRMGEDLELYSAVLPNLFRLTDPTERERISKQIAALSLEIKKGYQQFIAAYEQKYPGRLIHSLQSFRDGEIIK
jgi:hypothetical protein